jgi:UDP-N-acetylmuramate dehydrogenase
MIETLPNLQRNIPLGPLTTYKIGGPADSFVTVHSADELAAAVTAARAQGTRWFLLGTGANILVGDGGIRGLVIHNKSDHVRFDGNRLTAESGATIADLIEATAERGLSGLEHYAGIPSSVGGAIWQNLHFLAPDRQNTMFIETVVESARVLLVNGETVEVDRDWFNFGYDDSRLHHEEIVVLDVTFLLEPSTKDAILAQAKANLQWRAERQPPVEMFPSCGSVFKKIEGIGAGRLIDGARLKGYRIGGVQVSEKHANFLVNTDNGTAKDVMDLVRHIQTTVQADSGYFLEMEIRCIGEFT